MDSAGQLDQATIVVRRTAEDDVQQRQIIVKVDGKRVAQLTYGQIVTIPLTTGHHKLTVDNTWNRKTIELDLASGERREFLTRSRSGRFSWFLVGFIGAAPLYGSIEPYAETRTT